MNQYIADRLDGIRRSLVAQSRAAAGMPAAAVGAEREIFLTDFLARTFSPQFRFGTGCITDRAGNRSGQVDVVVELPFIPSLPVPPANVKLYLAEGVAAAIEIKSDLSAQWDQVEQTVASIKALRRDLPAGAMWRGPQPFEFIPTFAVGYRGYTTLDGLVHRLDSTPPARRPDAVLVLDEPGLFIAGTTAGDGPDAMLLFLGLISNFCTQIISAGFNVRAYVDWIPPTESHP